MTSEGNPEEPTRFSGGAAKLPSTAGNGNDNAVESTAIVLHPSAPQESQAPAQPTVPGAAATGVKRFVRQQVPDSILNSPALNEAVKALPSNYNFEIHKTIWRVQSAGAKTVALQFPEGLLMYSTTIADIIEQFAGVDQCIIMGDVTYGACCVDDFSARVMGADFLVHYGHSCLVPVDITTIPCMYVFVDIAIDIDHLVGSVKLTFPPGANLVLAGTIQFAAAVQLAKQMLAPTYPSLTIPKAAPLSPGEVLGCTAPVLTTQADAIVFVADGRFHLEAIMIANPAIPAFRYDPYGRVLTREHYDHAGMRTARRKAVQAAKGARSWGVVQGTLGRQGNPALVQSLQRVLQERGLAFTTFLISELSPARLALVSGVDAWVQVACPRLSIDWGEAFTKPTLTPYEAMVALGVVPAWWEAQQGEGLSGQNGEGLAAGARGCSVSCQSSKSASTGPGGAGSQPHQQAEAGGATAGCAGCSCSVCSCKQASVGGAGQGVAVPSCVTGQGHGSCTTEAGSTSQTAAVSDSSQPSQPGEVSLSGLEPYPMDYYARAGGRWGSTYHRGPPAGAARGSKILPHMQSGRSGVAGAGGPQLDGAQAVAAQQPSS